MAFNVTSLSPTLIGSIGVQPRLFTGVVTLVGGAATITLPAGYVVRTAWAESQTANAARVSATSANTLTLAGTGTDDVMWFAIVK